MKHADLPSVDTLVRARQGLPPPGPGRPATLVRIDAGPPDGRFELTFVVRQYSNGSWVWEISNSKRLDPPPSAGD